MHLLKFLVGFTFLLAPWLCQSGGVDISDRTNWVESADLKITERTIRFKPQTQVDDEPWSPEVNIEIEFKNVGNKSMESVEFSFFWFCKKDNELNGDEALCTKPKTFFYKFLKDSPKTGRLRYELNSDELVGLTRIIVRVSKITYTDRSVWKYQDQKHSYQPTQVNSGQSFALFKAASEGNVAAIETALAEGADVNARESEGETSLMYAAVAGRTNVVRFLINKGVDVNATSLNNETALARAALAGHREVIEVLLNNGAHIEEKAECGGSPLIYAALGGHAESVEILLKRGAEVDRRGCHGKTALMLAARDGQAEIVKLLLTAGANVNLIDEYGNTALDMARSLNRSAIIKILAKG